MIVETEAFGAVDVAERDIITFAQGILGFPDYTDYVLLPQRETAFAFLQSIEEPSLRFVVIMPELVRPDYTCSLSEAQAQELAIQSAADAEVFAIVTVPDDVTAMTVNLQAPVIVNPRHRLGKQIVLMDGDYHTRHNILAELQRIAFVEQKSLDAAKAAEAGVPQP